MHRKFVGKDESGSSLDDLDDDSGDQDDLVLIFERRSEDSGDTKPDLRSIEN